MKVVYDFMYKQFKMEKEQVDQTAYVVPLFAVLTVLALVVGYFVPATKPIVEAMSAWLGKALTILILGVGLILLGLGYVGIAVRFLVDLGDKKRASEIDLASWVHWTIAILCGVLLGAFWPSFVDYVVSFQTHLQIFFIDQFWLSDGVLVDPERWWFFGALAFFFGYFFNSLKGY